MLPSKTKTVSLSLPFCSLGPLSPLYPPTPSPFPPPYGGHGELLVGLEGGAGELAEAAVDVEDLLLGEEGAVLVLLQLLRGQRRLLAAHGAGGERGCGGEESGKTTERRGRGRGAEAN